MSDDSKELSRVEDILSGEDYLPKKPMSRVEELLMDGAMVPKVDDTDNGKVLKVIDGEWQPGEDVSGDNLPPVSSLDNGKVLKVVSGEWNIGDDKSESSFVYISSTYPFSGSKVALPANINSVLIANYTSSPKVPTFLVTSNNIIFEPKEVDISSGTTPSVHIRWGRMYSTFDSATREQDIYNDSLSYNTQNQTTEASYFKTKAIQTIPPVDTPDYGKVMQVGNGGTWQANYLPEVDGVPQVTSSDVGKVLKATAEGEYDWGDAPDPLPAVTSVDNGKVLKVVSGAWAAGADEGGSEAVYKTLAEYEALPTSDKEDPTKIYFVIDEGTKVSPTLAADDGNVEASSYFNNSQDQRGFPWHAFDGSDGSNGNKTLAWNPWNSGETWISYSFDTMYSFSKVRIYAEAWTNPLDLDYYIEGSNDGTTWTNIALKGGHVDVNFVPSTGVNNFQQIETVILLDGTKRYSKIRLRIDGPNINYGNACLFMVYDFSIYASNTVSTPLIYYKNILYNPNIKELPNTVVADAGKALVVNSDGVWDKQTIPTGLEVVKLSQSDYDSLSDAQKKNGKMYLIDASIFTGGIPRVSSYNSKISASSNNGSENQYMAWLAFDGIDHVSGLDYDGWVPSEGNNQWIKYHFDSATPINKIMFKAISRNTTPWTGTIYIEGSNDDTNWENILKDRVSIDTTLPDRDNSSVIFNENANGKSYTYVRLRISNQYTSSFELCEFDADVTTLTHDSIYYMDRQYSTMYEPVPVVTMADAGKALVVNSEGEWDKSLAPSVTPIRISKANYDALTPAQKTDPSKMYLIDGSIITDETLISPDDLRADDGKIVSTGYQGELYPWYVFSGYKSTAPFSNTFTPAYNSNTCYVGYHFTDKAHKITKVKYRVVWAGNYGTVTNSVYVEGSNDGTNWIDIGGGAVAMSIEQDSYSDYEVPCDMNEYSYIRIRFANPVNVTGSNKFFAVSYMEIYATETNRVYNAICYNGDEFASLDPQHYFKEISQTDYDALPDTKNSDGIIYFITDNS